ncbi:MAG: plasmid pRiA4b ORF-3 family protein [Acidimicrobiales bacterium]
MLVIRGTKKLRDRVKGLAAADDDVSTTELGDWFATALFWRPQVALLVNTRTFLPVFIELAPAATLLDRAPAAIEEVLRRHGVDEAFLTGEREAMSEVRIAPTNDRSVLGVMNEFAIHGEQHQWMEPVDLVQLSVNLAGMPLGPLDKRGGSPDRELASLVGGTDEIAKVTPLRPRQGTEARAATTPARSGDVYQLKVTLHDTKPPIWRRVLIDGASTLNQVHEVVQAAFGWWNYHLHEFEIGNTRYGVPDPDEGWGPPTNDESKVRLDSVVKKGSKFEYVYDFGDWWRHKIVVESVLPTDSTTSVPACVDGRRACPPEDCGGTWGYDDLLAILADPTHPEHDERVEWIGRPFDPELFDVSDFDENLRNQKLAAFDDPL